MEHFFNNLKIKGSYFQLTTLVEIKQEIIYLKAA